MVLNNSLPLFGSEEHFDKAKKHLWASDPLHGQSNSHMQAEKRESSTEAHLNTLDDIDCHPGQTGTSNEQRSPQSKVRPEAPECIFKALATCVEFPLLAATV
ncbi:hypothetical protein ID866_8519 [Astraeus odoratus]|nr:hypothetical protein ID866_8519 [Astraeus odoratus]